MDVTRRHLLAALAGVVALGGCTRPQRSALPLVGGGRVRLTMYVIDGAAQGTLAGLLPFLPGAARRATAQVEVAVQGAAADPPLSWFPTPTSLWNLDSTLYRDDPSIPMPDVVICRHATLPGKLAARALDLAPYLGLAQGALQGVGSKVVREGRAYSPGQGTIQAAAPLLRVPALAIVAAGVEALPGGRPWTTAQFVAAAEALAARIGPPSGPLPYVPVDLLAGAAAIGSGGALAQTTPGGSAAVFGQGPAIQGLADLVGWTRYAAERTTPGLQWGIWMGDGSPYLTDGGPPLPAPIGNWLGWRVVPLPVFPTRAAVPTNNIDVLVFRHTPHPDEAANLALGLLSAEAQHELRAFHGGLPVRAGPATDQLRGMLSRVQGAEYLADPSGDITDEDVWGGAETDANADALRGVQQNLTAALSALTGGRGDYSAPVPIPPPTRAEVVAALQAGQTAANAGSPVTAG